jgi:hypothetical protein
MHVNRFRKLVVACSVAIAGGLNASAYAHGLILPTTHLGFTRQRAYIGPTGVGSLSTRLNASIVKSVITSGYANGQNHAINQQLGGLVSGGYLSTQTYFNTGFSNLNRGETIGIAIGNNPFNNSTNTQFPNSPNYLSFSVPTKGQSGGFLGPSPTAGISGAERSVNAFYKSLAGSSTSAGEKSITSLGSLQGGFLTGTFYHSGAPFQVDAVAFGNNPYFTNPVSVLPASVVGQNYLSFSGGTRLVLGGTFTATLYNLSPFQNFGTYGYAFGNSPFNHGLVGPPSSTAFSNALYLARLFISKH